MSNVETSSATRPVALVTGAGGGIGRAAAATFARDGFDLVLCDITTGAAEAGAEFVRSLGTETAIQTFACDVASVESVESVAQALRDNGTSLKVLALIAGVVQDAASVTTMDVAEWDRIHGTNLRGPFLCARAWIPLMPENAGASIVNIASFWGESGRAFFSAYCTSKAGVISLTQSLAAELADKGIRANAVAPGNIDTPMHRSALRDEAEARGLTFEEMKDIEWAKIPLKIAGPAQSIADAVAFLASDRASYITGATLDVNGGVQFR